MTTPNVTSIATEIIQEQIAGKIFYKSKTFWANVLAFATMGLQAKYGFVMSAETQALILSAINLGLRSITKEPIIWS